MPALERPVSLLCTLKPQHENTSCFLLLIGFRMQAGDDLVCMWWIWWRRLDLSGDATLLSETVMVLHVK